jgi:drug/metabolite transporter (DMT)-like permease
MSNFLSIFVPTLFGSLAIACIGLAQRWAVKGKPSPMKFLAWGYTFVVLGLLGVYLAWWGWSWPQHLLPGVWVAVFCGAATNYVIQYLHAKAATYKEGEVSLTTPISAMTPGLITLLAITLGEFPGPLGLTGIACMAVGSWVLLYKGDTAHWWSYLSPLYRLRLIFKYQMLDKVDRERAVVVWLSLTAAAIGTVSILFDGLYTRRGGDIQGMWLAVTILLGILAVGYIIQYALQSPELKKASGSTGEWKFFAALVIFAVGWIIPQWLIKPLYFETYVAYVSTLYRIQVLFGVLLGLLIFKEQDIKHRLGAAVLVVLGAILISADGLPAHLTDKLEIFGF